MLAELFSQALIITGPHPVAAMVCSNKMNGSKTCLAESSPFALRIDLHRSHSSLQSKFPCLIF
jgi:hypothetical protein